jgi:hypothetical protein
LIVRVSLTEALASRAIDRTENEGWSGLRTSGPTFVLAIAASVAVWPVQAQPSFKTTKEMARECITDDLFLTGSCSGYIFGSIDVLENGRRERGEDSCLAGHVSKDQIVKETMRVILSQYADRGDLPASVLIEEFYHKRCGQKN